MKIGLDFDETYTRDPVAWDAMIRVFQMRGHQVYLTTWRHESDTDPLIEHLSTFLDGMFFCNGEAKRKYAADRGTIIDVFVDDFPVAVDRNIDGWRGHGVPMLWD